MNNNSSEAFVSANADTNPQIITNDISTNSQQGINAMPQTNSQPISQIAPLYDIGGAYVTDNLGMMSGATNTTTTAPAPTLAPALSTTGQVEYITGGTSHHIHPIPIQHHTTTTIPVLNNAKRKLDQLPVQSSAKRPTLVTNTGDPYTNVNPCPPSNSLVNDVVEVNEHHHGYLKSEYSGTTINAIPTPSSILPQAVYPLQPSLVTNETAVYDTGLGLPTVATSHPSLDGTHPLGGAPPNASLSGLAAPDASATKLPPPPSYAPQTIPSIQGTGHEHTTTTTAANPHSVEDQLLQQRREQYHKNRKQNFITFTKTLMKYLEIHNAIMHGQAKGIIKDCATKKKQGDLANANLGVNMQFRLRELVGEEYWKKTEELLTQSLMKEYQEKYHLGAEEAETKAREMARVSAAPLSGMTSLNGQPNATNGGGGAGCIMQ